MTDLEQEISNTLVEEISREIDKDILDSVMTHIFLDKGWTATGINPAFEKSIAPEIDWYVETAEWIHLNATGDYKLLKGQWLFEKPEDATMFILRWS